MDTQMNTAKRKAMRKASSGVTAAVTEVMEVVEAAAAMEAEAEEVTEAAEVTEVAEITEAVGEATTEYQCVVLQNWLCDELLIESNAKRTEKFHKKGENLGWNVSLPSTLATGHSNTLAL
jgi:hypothetical protein